MAPIMRGRAPVAVGCSPHGGAIRALRPSSTGLTAPPSGLQRVCSVAKGSKADQEGSSAWLMNCRGVLRIVDEILHQVAAELRELRLAEAPEQIRLEPIDGRLRGCKHAAAGTRERDLQAAAVAVRALERYQTLAL